MPQDPNDEPAQALYVRIQSCRKELVKCGTSKDAKVESNPVAAGLDSIPISWMWTRLGAVFDVRDGTHDTPKYTDQGFPVVTSKNIYSGRLSLDDVKLVSEADHRQISERSRVERGDILFAMIGSIGNPVIVDTDKEFSIKNVALFKYYTAADVVPRFLLLYLTHAAEEMKEKAAGGVQSFVSLGFLRNYPFPLAPLAEQHRIVAKVDELMALCDQLEQEQTANLEAHQTLVETLLGTLTRVASPDEFSEAWARVADHFDTLFTTERSIDQLKQTILQLAVMGKLVLQDPADEPASALLARIEKQKEIMLQQGEIRKQRSLQNITEEEKKAIALPNGWA